MVASVIRHPALPWECALGMDNGSQVRHQFRALVRVSGCQYCHHWGITLYPQQDIHDLTLRCGWWQHLVSCSSCKRHVSGISLAISTYSSSRILFISFGGIDPDWNWENFIGMLIGGVPAAVVMPVSGSGEADMMMALTVAVSSTRV